MLLAFRDHTEPRVRCTPAIRARQRLRAIDAPIAQPCAGRMSESPTEMMEGFPHASWFSEKENAGPRTRLGAGGAAVLYRGLCRDSPGGAVRARGPGIVVRPSSGAARSLAAAMSQARRH